MKSAQSSVVHLNAEISDRIYFHLKDLRTYTVTQGKGGERNNAISHTEGKKQFYYDSFFEVSFFPLKSTF